MIGTEPTGGWLFGADVYSYEAKRVRTVLVYLEDLPFTQAVDKAMEECRLSQEEAYVQGDMCLFDRDRKLLGRKNLTFGSPSAICYGMASAACKAMAMDI